MVNILLLHDNAGGTCHFDGLRQLLELRGNKKINICTPELSGFAGRELPETDDIWYKWYEEIADAVEGKTTEPWFVFTFGRACTIMMEFARRDWTFPNGYIFRPNLCIFYNATIATNHKHFKSRIAETAPFRAMTKNFNNAGFRRKSLTKKYFYQPESLKPETLDKFFDAYVNCPGYHTFVELASQKWYEEIQPKIWHQRFHFAWGHTAIDALPKWNEVWQKDFPKSSFEIIPNWGNYPMIDRTSEFLEWINKFV